jgi:hypothetical protein
MANATVVALPEGGGPNTGFMYCRGAHPDGAARWRKSSAASTFLPQKATARASAWAALGSKI